MTSETNVIDWKETLPEDWTITVRAEDGSEREIPLREHPALARYASKDEAVKALVHAQKLLGRTPEGFVRLPGEDADEAAWAELWAALGRPDAPSGYDLPEGVELPADLDLREDVLDEFLSRAFDLGLTGAQVRGIMEWFLPRTLANIRELSLGVDQRRRTELDALRAVHRGETAGVLDQARQAALALGGPDLLEALDACGASDRACVVSSLARLAPLLLEGGMRGRAPGTAEALSRDQLNQMMRDPRYHDPLQRDPEFVKRIEAGFEALYPGTHSGGASRG